MNNRSLIALTAIALTLLAGCGGGSGSSEASDVAPIAVPPVATNSPPVISGDVPGGKENVAFFFKPSVSDSDGDTLTLSASNLPAWLNFDAAKGEFFGTPTAENVGRVSGIRITANDGKTQTNMTFEVIVAFDQLEQAIRTGDQSYLASRDMVLDGLLKTIKTQHARYDEAKAEIFSAAENDIDAQDFLTNVSWNPTWDAALLVPRFGVNEAILSSNAVTNQSYTIQERALAVIGESDTTRYAVFGSNPMRNAFSSPGSLSQDMRQVVNNTLNWLSKRSAEDATQFNVVLSQLSQEAYFPDQLAIRIWLDEQYGDLVRYNTETSCNGDRLGDCLTQDTDLLIISQRLFDNESATTIADQVKAAMQNGIPVLYVHHDGNYGELAQRLFPLFDVGYHGDNYWRRLSIEAFDNNSTPNTLPTNVAETKMLFQQFKAQSFTADLGLCENRNCPDDHPYNNEFKGPVETIQGQLKQIDEQGIRLFEERKYRYQQLLVLTGDYFRQRVKFPMDNKTTPTTTFLESMFADHANYYNRATNPAQPDMGNFSRSDFSHITPTSRRVQANSKPSFRSTGAYALPGVPFTVTRHDYHNVITHVFVNTLRSGATHQFDENAYSRPKHLQSSKYRVDPGQTLSLTSSYGGPIQIQYSVKDLPVDIEFGNVGEHPYWASNADDATFAAGIEAGDYDWAELTTPSFEVHSKLEKMRATLDNPVWNSASKIAAATVEYTHNYPHVLAGFRGPGIDVVPEIHDFASSNGLDIDTLDKVKHMNADQATCGYGCSGNPYDAYWSFSPLGHGDLHELGHGLERSRFRFAGWDGHASTNPYSYYSKSRYFENTGDMDVLKGCQKLPFSTLFETVHASAKTGNPGTYMRDANLNNWSHGVAIYLQLMMRVQEDGALASGWNLLPRLHIVEREFSRADDNDESWNAKRAGLGFAGMSRTDARRLSNNDWLLIALSHVTGRDLRDYMSMWGLSYSYRVNNQLDTLGLPSLPAALHLSDSQDYCLGLDHRSVPVDGAQAWPHGS